MADLTTMQNFTCANVFVMINEALQNSINSDNAGITGFYNQQSLLNQQSQAEMANWQKDSDALPNAGLEDPTPASSNTNSTAIGVGVGLMAASLALGVLSKVLFTMAGAEAAAAAVDPALGGSASALFIVAGVLAAVSLTLAALGASALSGNMGTWTSDLNTTIPGHTNYDSGAQSAAQQTVAQDQQNVSQLQTQMTTLLQQYINPANSSKETAANIEQAVFQWLKAIVWTQGAA